MRFFRFLKGTTHFFFLCNHAVEHVFFIFSSILASSRPPGGSVFILNHRLSETSSCSGYTLFHGTETDAEQFGNFEVWSTFDKAQLADPTIHRFKLFDFIQNTAKLFFRSGIRFECFPVLRELIRFVAHIFAAQIEGQISACNKQPRHKGVVRENY